MTGVFLLCFLYFLPRPGDWNQDARRDLTLAMVNHGSAAIDPYHWNTGIDSVLCRDQHYTDKAPGQSLVGVPIYAVYRAILSRIAGAQVPAQIGLRA